MNTPITMSLVNSFDEMAEKKEKSGNSTCKSKKPHRIYKPAKSSVEMKGIRHAFAESEGQKERKWPLHCKNSGSKSIDYGTHLTKQKMPFNVNMIDLPKFAKSPKELCFDLILPSLTNSIYGNIRFRRRHMKSFFLGPLVSYQ